MKAVILAFTQRARHAVPKQLRLMLRRIQQRLIYAPPAPTTSEQSALEVVEVSAGPTRGCKMLLDRNSPSIWYRGLIDGVYDAFIYDDLKFNMDLTEAVVWDVGAHIGYHSLCFSTLVGPKGKVISFELNEYNRALR